MSDPLSDMNVARVRRLSRSEITEPVVLDAVGEWWIYPLATYQQTPYQHTVYGGISSTGVILACEFNHGTGATRRYEVGQAVVDDHCVPALWVMDGHRSVIAWNNHGEDFILHVKVGSRSGALASLVSAPDQPVNQSNFASYVQIHRIAHLSDDAQDTFWVFSRRSNNAWIVQPMSVAQATGVVTFLTRKAFISMDPTRQIYCSVADAFVSSGNQTLRVAMYYNPALSQDAIYYFEIDCVTGAITSKPNTAFSATLGTNFDPEAVAAPIIAEPVSTSTSRRMFYVRSGPDDPAIAYAEWDTSTPDEALYHVAVINTGDIGLIPGTGMATAGHHASMDSGGFAYTVVVKTPSVAPASFYSLGRRFASAGNGWYFRIDPLKKLTIRFGASGSGDVNATSSVGATFNWGDVVGFRFVVDQAGHRYYRYYSTNPLDASPTWTEIGATGGVAFTGTVVETTQPLSVPVSDTNFTGIPVVYSAHLRDQTNTTLIAGVDFTTEWPDGDTVFTDDAGRSWSLSGGARVVGPVTDYELGIAGPRVGYTASSNYIAGLAFETPSYDGTVIRAQSIAGVETVDRLFLVDNGYIEENLRTQLSTAGRLIRPTVPVNGGPIAAMVTDMKQYADDTYTEYDGNVRSL